MEKVVTLSFLIHRGSSLEVSLPANATVRELGERLQVETGIAPHTLRLLVPYNKKAASSALLPFSSDHGSLLISRLGIPQGRPIRVMGALPEEIEELSQKAGDSYGRLIPGFLEEERKAKHRMAISPSGATKLPQGNYIFCDFRTLQLPGIVLYPPAEKAVEIMHSLASDPGIVAIMNKHRWRVGVMTEMAPIGYVGISPKCILGYNKNHGEEISLRLRTDDLKGFRKYASIKKTLLHELAHMVHSEHDANFHALDKQLNEEAIALDWTKAQSHRLAGSMHLSDEDLTDAGGVITTSKSLVGHKVGGSKEHQRLGARSAAGLAALDRFSTDMERQQGDDMETEIDVIAEGNDAHIGAGRATSTRREPDPDEENEMLEPGLNDVNGMEIHGVGKSHAVIADGLLVLPVPKGELLVDAHKEKERGCDDTNKEPGEIELDLDSKERRNSEAGIAEQSSVGADVVMSEKQVVGTDIVTNGGIVSPVSSFPPSSKLDVVANEGSRIATHDYITEDLGLKSLQDHADMVCKRVHAAISTLKSEATPSEAAITIQTLTNILRNIKEHPNEARYKRLRKTNPAFQSRVAKFKGALEVLQAVGFSDGPFSDDNGEIDCLVLARNDPVLIWLAQTTLEECIA